MLRTILTPIKDDTEEAPWMVMGTAQWDAVNAFYDALATYARTIEPPLYVAAMLPLRYRPNPPHERVEQLAPDVMVARVPNYDRSSYDVEREGVAPCFVLEVISRESRRRDMRVKPPRYERMGVQEYALFRPARSTRAATLQGYRRDQLAARFMPWEPDEYGRFYSEQLGLWLALRDEELRLQRDDGIWLPTYGELDAERLAEQAARQAAEAGWKRELAAREAAEAEVARLRAELERRDKS